MKETTNISPVGSTPLEERTDRELEISKIYLQRESNKRLRSIDNNLKFFFWLTLLGIAVLIIAYIIMESNS